MDGKSSTLNNSFQTRWLDRILMYPAFLLSPKHKFNTQIKTKNYRK